MLLYMYMWLVYLFVFLQNWEVGIPLCKDLADVYDPSAAYLADSFDLLPEQDVASSALFAELVFSAGY